MSRVSFFALFSILFFLYVILFIQGNYNAADRASYLNIFMTDHSNRIEPGFVLIVQLLRRFLSASVALNTYAASLFITAYMAIYFILRDLRQSHKLPLDFHLYIIFITFAVFGVFVFIQIRAGLVVFLSSTLIHLYTTRSSKFALPGILLLGAIHYLAIPLFIFTLLFYKLKLNSIIVSILCVIMVGFAPNLAIILIDMLGLNPYYALYFNGILVNTSLLSAPSVIILYILFLLSLAMSPRFVFGTKFFFPTLSIVFVSAFVGLDIIIKVFSPYILLCWLYFFSRVRDPAVQALGSNLYIFMALSLSALSISFAIFAY